MVRVERRKGLLFSVIILGAVVSGSVYFYLRDNWNLEAKVRSYVFEFQLHAMKHSFVNCHKIDLNSS